MRSLSVLIINDGRWVSDQHCLKPLTRSSWWCLKHTTECGQNLVVVGTLSKGTIRTDVENIVKPKGNKLRSRMRAL